uniref:EF-hand domain-containing protein n=1 Tax=Plectus sambesii TaxID=2011161 RepID=A0A914VW95_9BILA
MLRILCLAVVCHCAFAAPADTLSQPRSSEDLFKAVDANHDSFISVEEAVKQGLSLTVVQEVFAIADEDKDAKISFPEFQMYGAKVRARSKAEDERKMAAAANSLLTLVDHNANGKISFNELRVFAGQFGGAAADRTKQLFDELDSDKDEELNGEEVSNNHEKVAILLQVALIPATPNRG